MIADLLLKTVLESGAANAEIIDCEKVVLSSHFRKICESNQCGNYDRNWSCPPDIGSVEELMGKVREYPQAMLYQTIYFLEDSYDIEGMMEASHRHSLLAVAIQQQAAKLLSLPFLHMSGSCHLCETCAKITQEPCRNPDKLIPSISAFGVDVNSTVKNTSMKYINGQNTVTYFGLLLFADE